MSKRMQVLIEDSEYREIQKIARSSKVTVAEWVRQALRAARRREPRGDIGKKLDALRLATQHSFPISDMGQVLAEIERGCTDEGRS